MGLQTFQIPGEGWYFSINQTWITKQMLEVICMHINGLPAEKHWKAKFQLSGHLQNTIDWNSLEWAYKEPKEPIRHWVVKYTSGFLPW